MAGRYSLKVILDFAAAHHLRDYPGDCSRLHGHNWKLEVEVTATALDQVGMGVDFKVIRNAARTLADTLDHQYLNELPEFSEKNPTAENIAAYFYKGLSKTLNNSRVSITAITIWETDRACVRYYEEK